MVPVMVLSSFLLPTVIVVLGVSSDVGFIRRSFNAGINSSSKKCSVAPLSTGIVISLFLG